MKLRILSLAFLSFSLMVLVTSCNKTEDVTPQYQRCGNSLVLAADGNLVIAGYEANSSNGYDATLVMVDPVKGDTTWTKTFGGSFSDAFYNVNRSNSGGIIATGFSNRANASSPALLVVITDIKGKVIKQNTYPGASASQGFSVISCSDSGGYLVAGIAQKTSNSDRDIYLVRINDAGDLKWSKTIGAKSIDQYDTVNDAGYDVIEAPGGGYFITGSLNGYSQYGGKIFLMKVSAKGDSLWTKTYGNGIGYSLTLTKDNGIAISGSLQEGASQDVFLLKTDLDGNRFTGWTENKVFGGSGFEYGASMLETSSGGFAIAGITDSKGAGGQDVYLITTNSTGVGAKEFTYGFSGDDQGFGLVEMPDNGFSITGLSNSGGSYIFLNRVQSDGTPGSVGWTKKYFE
jgi:hypothetical protein